MLFFFFLFEYANTSEWLHKADNFYKVELKRDEFCVLDTKVLMK